MSWMADEIFSSFWLDVTRFDFGNQSCSSVWVTHKMARNVPTMFVFVDGFSWIESILQKHQMWQTEWSFVLHFWVKNWLQVSLNSGLKIGERTRSFPGVECREVALFCIRFGVSSAVGQCTEHYRERDVKFYVTVASHQSALFVSCIPPIIG